MQRHALYSIMGFVSLLVLQVPDSLPLALRSYLLGHPLSCSSLHQSLSADLHTLLERRLSLLSLCSELVLSDC